MTSTVPPPAGEVAVMLVAEWTVKLVALLAPNLTAFAVVKSVPVMTTEVPPPGAPLAGLIPVTVTGET